MYSYAHGKAIFINHFKLNTARLMIIKLPVLLHCSNEIINNYVVFFKESQYLLHKLEI